MFLDTNSQKQYFLFYSFSFHLEQYSAAQIVFQSYTGEIPFFPSKSTKRGIQSFAHSGITAAN